MFNLAENLAYLDTKIEPNSEIKHEKPASKFNFTPMKHPKKHPSNLNHTQKTIRFLSETIPESSSDSSFDEAVC